MKQLTDWISVYDNAIPDEFCDACITMFEDVNLPKGEHREYWRRCKELSTFDQTHLWEKLKGYVLDNYNKYRTEHISGVLNYANYLEAPNMYRYDVNPEAPNLFSDHADCWNFPTSTRQVSVIVYLNDVIEGGATTFTQLDMSVAPKKGRILLFPSFFNYIHKGESPISNSKYIIVSWIHFDGNTHAYRVHKL